MKFGTGAKIGIIIGCLGGLVGMIVGIMAAPLFGSIFAVVFISIFAFVLGPMFRNMSVKNKLMKTGVAATARVVQVSDTGVTVNNNPQIKLLLEVTAPNSSPYMVETKEIISRLQTSSFQIGNILPVKVDLNDKNLVAIDYSGSSSAASYSGASSYNSSPTSVLTGPWTGMSAAEVDRKLHEINDANEALVVSGEPAKAVITKYTWLGVYVGEDNPAVEFEVEVIPNEGSAFKAKVIGILKASSVPKYQPGCEIFVAYDRNDRTKVTITHS